MALTAGLVLASNCFSLKESLGQSIQERCRLRGSSFTALGMGFVRSKAALSAFSSMKGRIRMTQFSANCPLLAVVAPGRVSSSVHFAPLRQYELAGNFLLAAS